MSNRVNWLFVKQLYRTGNLTNCEIVRQYAIAHCEQDDWKGTITEGAIRARARTKDWKKDLAGDVRRQVLENLVRANYEPDCANSKSKTDDIDERTIELAAASIAGMVKLHRGDLEKLRVLELKLIQRLEHDEDQVVIGWYKGEAHEHRVKMGLVERSKVLKNYTTVLMARIKAERQAWGIDEEPDQWVANVEVIQNF